MSENPLNAVAEDTDFLSRARGAGRMEESDDGVAPPPKEVLERLS
jgi:hypothetical protein